MIKKIIALVCIIAMASSMVVCAAPDVLYSTSTGNSNNIIVITNPPTDKSATFDMSYIISGYGRPGADVTMYIYDGSVYRKSAYTWTIGASGLFFKKITLAKGKNALICYGESGSQNQTVPLEITYLGATFMNTLNNAVINVTQVPTR